MTCTCQLCGRVDFDADEMADNAAVECVAGGKCCKPCADLRMTGHAACDECAVGERGVLVTDPASGRQVTDWCVRYNGDGVVKLWNEIKLEKIA